MSPKNHNIIFESVRGLAALAVCILHMTALKVGPFPMEWAFVGGLGVDLFFVLSGFLIARCVLFPDHFQVSTYLAHRSRRILPAYFACLFLFLAVGDSRDLVRQDVFPNLGLHLSLLHGWSETYFQRLNPPFWTLSHEWCYYLLMAVAAPLLRGKQFWIVTVVMVAVSVTLRWLHQVEKINLPMAYQHPLCMWDRFACGMIAARVALSPRLAAVLQPCRWMAAICLLGGVALIWAIWRYQAMAATIPVRKLQDVHGYAEFVAKAHRSRTLTVFQPLALSAGLSALLCAGWLRPAALSAVLRCTPLPAMGKVSYSTYLWHMPVLLSAVYATAKFPDSWLSSPWTAACGLLGLIYLVSWICYRGFEFPFLRRK